MDIMVVILTLMIVGLLGTILGCYCGCKLWERRQKKEILSEGGKDHEKEGGAGKTPDITSESNDSHTMVQDVNSSTTIQEPHSSATIQNALTPADISSNEVSQTSLIPSQTSLIPPQTSLTEQSPFIQRQDSNYESPPSTQDRTSVARFSVSSKDPSQKSQEKHSDTPALTTPRTHRTHSTASSTLSKMSLNSMRRIQVNSSCTDDGSSFTSTRNNSLHRIQVNSTPLNEELANSKRQQYSLESVGRTRL